MMRCEEESSGIWLRMTRATFSCGNRTTRNLLIAFHDGTSAKTVNLSLQGTPAEAVAGISTLFGNGTSRLGGATIETGSAATKPFGFCAAVGL